MHFLTTLIDEKCSENMLVKLLLVDKYNELANEMHTHQKYDGFL